MDASADATKSDATNDALDFRDAEVSSFSDKGLDAFLDSLALFVEDLASWYFLKKEDVATRRYFEIRS